VYHNNKKEEQISTSRLINCLSNGRIHLENRNEIPSKKVLYKETSQICKIFLIDKEGYINSFGQYINE
jgi:hypothetical protein